MEESDAAAAADKRPNGEASGGGRSVEVSSREEDTLPGVLRSFVEAVCSAGAGEPLRRRIRAASCESAPRLREASRNSARDLLEWTRRGSGLRAILVISCKEGWDELYHIFLKTHDQLLPLRWLVGWNDHAYFIDWPSSFHVLPAGCNHQCCCCFRPDVTGSCWRIPGYVLCLLGCSVYWSSICCCFCHFHHGYLSNCWYHDCNRLAWILLDDLVCSKEEHGPYEALDRRDKFGYPIIFCFSPCEAEAYWLGRAVTQFQVSYRRAVWLPYRLKVMCYL